MKDVYLAAPWFTPWQFQTVEKIKALMDDKGVSYYSPKDECLFTNGSNLNPVDVLNTNIKAITEAKYVIALTDGKDPGTIWECGYAFSIGKPIIYVWLSREPGQKFNLMLAASGVAVCSSYEEIAICITQFVKNGSTIRQEFIGDIE